MQINTSKRAFTLIELLVVIAIIAILAAILFPVFAQAKEAAKKATGISNLKQAATSLVLYTTDNEDRMPHGIIRASGGAWSPGLLAEVPVDWRLTSTATHERHSIYWANAVQPYMKNIQLLEISDGTRDIPGTALAGKAPAYIGVNYNGLLTTYMLGAVEQPSSVPMVWYGVGRTNRAGQDLSVPQIRCTGVGPCMFNPSGYPDDGNGGGNTSATAWYIPDSTTSHRVFGNGTVFTYTDTSTKFRRIGQDGDGVVGDKMSDPYSTYNPKMKALTYWGCKPTGSAASVPTYWCYFRPDQVR